MTLQPAPPLDVAQIYEAHFDFVWRSLRRLGVPASALEDALQDVFIVVQRRLGDFQGRSSVSTWLFGIVLRIATDYRRKNARRLNEIPTDDAVLVGTSHDPYDAARETEAARLVQEVLDAMPDERKVVFVMIELEDLAPLEVAEQLGVGINTVYSRLRLARRDFEARVLRLRAHERWRQK